MTSTYDKIHDRHQSTSTTKAGTRYERLAALVAKKLNETANVTHDVRLRGDSDVQHQIDVRIARAAGKRRVLIECKDFDVSGDKVGLDIVRSFWAVVDDVEPDDAFVITCNGFTRDAAKFAKAKGIKLAVLRAFTTEDWKGRVREIHLRFHIKSLSDPKVSFGLGDEANIGKLQQEGMS